MDERFIVTVEYQVVTLTTHKVVVCAHDAESARRAVQENFEVCGWDYHEEPTSKVLATGVTVVDVQGRA